MKSSWWQERESLPAYSGFIQTSEAPDYSDFFSVPGGKSSGFNIAVRLIESFETGIIKSGNSKFDLVDIEVREKTSMFNYIVIPLCPNPKTIEQDQIPDVFRSVGVLMNDYSSAEIWFVVRIHLAETGFTWRLDYTFREKTAAKIGRRSFSFVLGVLSGKDPETLSDLSERAKRISQQYLPPILNVWNEAISKIEKETQSHFNSAKNGFLLREQPTRRD